MVSFDAHRSFFVSPPSRRQVDLIILPLTSVPLVGFWKLIPTFGGCIATKAKCSLAGDKNEVVEVRQAVDRGRDHPRHSSGCSAYTKWDKLPVLSATLRVRRAFLICVRLSGLPSW